MIDDLRRCSSFVRLAGETGLFDAAMPALFPSPAEPGPSLGTGLFECDSFGLFA
jgi:hypothetical protein